MDRSRPETAQIQAKALLVLRPLLVYAAAPLSLLFLALEVRAAGLNVGLVGQALGTLMMVAALFDPRRLDRRALPFCLGFGLYAAMSMLHFGWVFGVGLFFSVAVVATSFFFGSRGTVVAVIGLTSFTAVVLAGHQRGWWTLAVGPGTLVDALRMFMTTGVALAVLGYVFVRVLEALREAHDREYSAEAERQIAERERARAVEQAMQAQRLETVGRLASGVAHDFNNALMVLQGSIELLGLDLDPAKREQLVSEGVAAVEGASATARQLLDFARPGGETEGRCEPGPILERLERSMNRVLPESLVLNTRIDPCPPVPVSRGVLEQMLLNLILNARDAIPGQGRIELRCATGPAGNALLEVVDDGVGMDEDTRQRLFEPFFTTKGERGTGLGLAMVHAFARHSGGEIEVESAPGRGTRIVLRWPPTEAAADPPAIMARVWPSSNPGGRAILVVEDNPDVARVMARALTRGGYSVTTAHTVAEAAQQLERGRFAVVCSDGLLADGTARDVQRHYWRRQPGAPMLLCSGYADRPELAEAIEGGATLLAKPFASPVLLERVGELVESSA